MKKHLFLIILTLAVLSASNVWAGDTFIFPVTPASTCSGGTLSQDANGMWYYEMSDASDYVEIQFAVTELQTYFVKVGYSTSVTGATCNLQYYRQGSEVGNYQFGMGHGASVSDVITEVNCGALLTSDKLHPDNQFKPPYAVRVHPAQDKTMRVYYLKLEGQATGSQTTETIPSSLDLVFTSTANYNMISNSDFLYTRKEGDQVKAYDKGSIRRITFKNGIVAASRKLYTFETGTYKFTFHAWSDVSHSDYKAPYVFINGVVAGASDFSINKDVRNSHDIEVEIDVTAGTYPVEFYFPDSYDEQLFYTTVSVEKKAVSCANYSFHYGIDGQAANTWGVECFEYSGAGSVYYVNDFTIPEAEDATHFYVGYQGSFYNDKLGYSKQSRSKTRRWHETNADANSNDHGEMYFAAPIDNGNLTVHVGQAAGAKGKIRINDDSDWNNLRCTFVPDGYVLKVGSSEYPFTLESGNEYRSDLVELSSTNARDAVSVGIEDEDGDYVATDNSEGRQHLFLDVTTNWSGDNAKFVLYDVTHSSFTCAMTQVPGNDKLYEGWVPANCSTVIFVRRADNTLSFDNKWNQTGDLTLESGKNYFTITDWEVGTWSTYEKKGKFSITDNINSKNWGVHFMPHYVVSFAANGGSGSMAEQSIAVYEADTETIDLAACSFTAPTGHEFANWKTNAAVTANSTSVAADGAVEDEAELSDIVSDITLTAQWSPLSYDVTLHTNGGTINAGNVTSYTYGVSATLPTDVTKTGYDFGGWYDNSELTGDRVYSIANNVTGNKEYWAKWTPKVYNITYMDGASEFAGTHEDGYPTTHTYGTATTLKSATKAGYTLEGWYTEAQLTNKVTSLGATAYTADITLYANWTPTSTVSTPTVSAASDTYCGTPIDISLSATSSACSNPVVVFFVNDGTTTFEVTGAPYGSDGNGAVGTVNGSAPYTTVHKATFTATKAATYTVTAKLYEGLLVDNFETASYTTWENTGNGASHSYGCANPGKTAGNGSNKALSISRASTSDEWAGALTRFVLYNTYEDAYAAYRCTGKDYDYLHVRMNGATANTKLKNTDSYSTERISPSIESTSDAWKWVSYPKTNCKFDFLFFIINSGTANVESTVYFDDIILSNESSMTEQATSSSASTTIAPPSYAIATSATNGSVSVVSSAAEGDEVTITATPSGGYEFSSWTITKTSDVSDITASVSLSGQTSSATFTMPAYGVTVTATFVAETCNSEYVLQAETNYITLTRYHDAMPSGLKIIPTQEEAYNEYTGYTGTGYADWKNTAGAIYFHVDLPAGTYNFTIRNNNCYGDRYINIYKVGAEALDGHSVEYNSKTYGKVQSANLGRSEDGKSFSDYGWNNRTLEAGDYIISYYAPAQWTALDKITITDVSTYTVTYNATGAATGSTISAVDEDENEIESGDDDILACTVVTFTATPASGYEVEHWQVNGVTYPAADGLTDFTLAINRNVTVTYTTVVASAYAVSVNTNNVSYGSASADAATYASGATVTLTATPETGYGFVNWTTSDGVTFADANSASTTFTMPSKNVTVTANFAELRTVNFEVFGGNGSISAQVKATGAPISSGAQVPSGTMIRFTATPNPGYNVQGWYTYQSSTEVQQGNDVNTTFDYTFNTTLTIRVKFTQIRIATGNTNLGSTDEYANSDDGSTIATSNVDDPEGKFNHKVLQVDYKMVSASDQVSYRGISLPVDAGYTKSIASGKAGMGFWYRTESTTDKVLTYFCIGGTDDSHQFETLLPATNGKWQYWYIETDKVDDNTTFGFYINGTKNGKSSGTINADAKFWLSEVEPITPADVTVEGNETKEIASVVRDLTIYQGGEVTNSEDVIVTRNIYYHRHAKGGALSNKLDQWYTFAVPFTVSDIEVNESSMWYDINAVYYSDNNNQSGKPDGLGHFYLQYLSAENVTAMGSEFADRWKYITPDHSLYLDADAFDWDGSRYGYPMKDSAYIILFDSDQPIGTYFQTNTEIRFVGGAQTIDGTAKEWKVEADGEQYWMYANNTLHSFTLTDAYILNGDGTKFVLQDSPRIRPFECYVQATASLKEKCAAISMRGFRIDNTTTGAESIQGSAIRAEKILRNGQLIIIRNGVEYDATGVVIR